MLTTLKELEMRTFTTFDKMLDALAHEGESSTVMLQEKCALFSAITKNKQNILVFKIKEPNEGKTNELNITI